MKRCKQDWKDNINQWHLDRKSQKDRKSNEESTLNVMKIVESQRSYKKPG